jgi:hypothetical protein
MLGEIRAMADGLVDLANASAARFQPREPAAQDQEKLEAGAGSHDGPTTGAIDESASAVPTAGSEGSSGESAKSSEEDVKV